MHKQKVYYMSLKFFHQKENGFTLLYSKLFFQVGAFTLKSVCVSISHLKLVTLTFLSAAV